MANETKKCPVCDAEIGASETNCPKCSTDFTDLDEETLSKLDTALTIVEKRRAAKLAAEEAKKPKPPDPPKRRTIFDSLKGKRNV